MILMACGARPTTAPQFQLGIQPYKVYRATIPNQQQILLDMGDMLTCSVHAAIFSFICFDKVHICGLD